MKNIKIVSLVMLATILLTGCLSESGRFDIPEDENSNDIEEIIIEAPSFSPGADEYNGETEITIEASDGDIYYTIADDGSEPIEPSKNSQKYENEPIGLEAGKTTKIKAIAYKEGITSEPVTATYLVSSDNEDKPSEEEEEDTETTDEEQDESGNNEGEQQTDEGQDESDNNDDEQQTGETDENLTNNEFTYVDTVYKGKTTEGTGIPRQTVESNINITSPSTAEFNADGFFRINGSVTGTGANQYAWIVVSKNSSFMDDVDVNYDSSKDTTYYWVRGDFDRRIWLPFGSGTYVIDVLEAEITVNNLNYEGDILRWSYKKPAIYSFTVNNTRNEVGKFLYPSDEIQSDDELISGKATEIIEQAGVSSGSIENKAKAIHDFVVDRVDYDNVSAKNDGRREKQDAISTYNNKKAVCEGYTSLFAAMLRSQGIKTKAISGFGDGGPHAWAEVWDGSNWRLVDPTWNDSSPSDKYWWETSYNSDVFSESHEHKYDRPNRTIEKNQTIELENGTIQYKINLRQ